jgi:hypothetical protein
MHSRLPSTLLASGYASVFLSTHVHHPFRSQKGQCNSRDGPRFDRPLPSCLFYTLCEYSESGLDIYWGIWAQSPMLLCLRESHLDCLCSFLLCQLSWE